MYHVELRQFPHSAWRFNLSEAQLRALLEPWTRQAIVDFGEQKWRPETATLTVLEGPELALADLSMGRGWRSAQRKSRDVTERELARARETIRATVAAAASARSTSSPTTADSRSGAADSDPLALAVQLAALLGPDATRLLEAWRAAAASEPALRPSDALARAEQALRSAGVD